MVDFDRENLDLVLKLGFPCLDPCKHGCEFFSSCPDSGIITGFFNVNLGLNAGQVSGAD